MAEQLAFDPVLPIGVYGLRRQNGTVNEEWLRQLQGVRGRRIYREMRDNEPIIGASLWAIELLIRQVSWSAIPSQEDNAGIEAADYVTSLLADMGQSWHDTLSMILTMNVYGWSAHEILYKLRQGAQRNPAEDSQFADGRYGWHALALRAQDTLERWDFGTSEEVRAMIQRPPQTGKTLVIPAEKLLLFHARNWKGSPEGQSLLRSAYLPWYYKRRVQELEAIGIERDLAGYPVLYVPFEWLDPTNPSSTTVRAAYEDAIRNLRRNEDEGMLLPSIFDEQGNQLCKIELLSTGSSGRQVDTTEVIKQKNLEMLVSLFTDVLMIGHEQTGSMALHSSKTSLLATALGAMTASIADVINREALPRLWRLNGMPMATMPTLSPGDIESVDLRELGDFIRGASQAGFDVLRFEDEVWRRAGFAVEGQE